MDIKEMHVTFRELGQQMGSQTVRAILDEDIDICLNASIIAVTKQIIQSNIKTVSGIDKVARQNSSISPINALRTLYRKNEIKETEIKGEGTEVKPYYIELQDDIMLYTGFKISYNEKTIYDCRIVEIEDLGQTLRDFSNRAAKDAPICTVFNNSNKINVEIYTGRTTMAKPKIVQYLYIADPAKVVYDEDVESNNVSCDLPSYLHMEIVEGAVRYYLMSIGANLKQDNRSEEQ